MIPRKVVYVCKNGHRLSFTHNFDNKGKSGSGSPAVCLTCASVFVYAETSRGD